MKSRYLLMTAAVLALVPLSACTTPSSPGRPVDLSFSQMQPIDLSVNTVQIVDQSNNPAAKNMPRVNPAEALKRYATRRLHAVGGEGTLNFIILQASVTSAESEGTGNWTEAFQLSKPMEYTVTMRIGLDMQGRTSQSNVRSAYTLERKKTLNAGASLADRDREVNRLIEDMVRDMDKAIQTGLANNMHVVVSPGAITFGTPAPLVSQGTAMVQPVPPGPVPTAPVIIQGTMD